MENGCSRHITDHVKLLSKLTNCSGPKITFKVNSKDKTVGKGNIVHGNNVINEVLSIENMC